MAQAAGTGYVRYTPSIPLAHGPEESPAMLFDEGLEHVLARRAFLARGVRAALQRGLRLEPRASELAWFSVAAPAVMLTVAADDAKVVARALRRCGPAPGAGHSRVAGRPFRTGHAGGLNEPMPPAAIAEVAMLHSGARLEPGSGVVAAGKDRRRRAALAGPRA